MKSGYGLSLLGGVKIILILLLVFTLVGGSAYLVLPVIGIDMVDNTTDLLLGDMGWLERTDERLADKGYEGELEINIPTLFSGLAAPAVVKSSFVGYGSGEDEVCNTIITLGTPNLQHTFDLFYSEEIIALGGLGSDADSNTVISIPRKDIRTALDGSVFHPDSGSEYALDTETYGLVCDAIDNADESTDDGISEILTRIIERSYEYGEKERHIYFAEDEFALERVEEWHLDGEDISRIIDIVFEELIESDLTADAINSLPNFELTAIVDTLKDTFRDAEVDMTFVISHSRLSEANVSIRTKNDGSDEQLDIALTVEGNKKDSTVILDISSNTVADGNEERDSIKIRLDRRREGEKNNTDLTVLVSDKKMLEINISHNGEKGDYTADFSTYIGEISSTMSLAGRFLRYKWYSGYEFSVDSLSADGILQHPDGQPIISIMMKENPEAKELTPPEADNLFTMTDQMIDELVAGFPVNRFLEIYAQLIGDTVIYTEEGIPVMNGVAVDQIANKLVSYFEKYRSRKPNDTAPKVNKIYYYLEELELYFLISYSESFDTYSVSLYYNPGDLLDEYHPVRLGSGEIIVHDLKYMGYISSGCMEPVTEFYVCTICGQEIKQKGSTITGHGYAISEVEYEYELGKIANAQITYCIKCNKIESIRFDDKYINCFNMFDPPELAAYYGSEIKHLVLPDAVFEYEGMIDFKFSNGSGFENILSLKIPEGRRIIEDESFDTARNLQVLVLPSTLTEIEDGAFTTGTDLKYVIFLGTEEQWQSVDLNGYAEKWVDVNLIFAPNGVSASEIYTLCFDLDGVEEKLGDKKTQTEGIDAALSLADTYDKVSLVYDGKVSFAAYDITLDILAVAEVGEGVSTVRLINPDTAELIGELEIDEPISSMDFDGGRLALGSTSSQRVYIYTVSSAELTHFNLPQERGIVKQVFVDGDSIFVLIGYTNSTTTVYCYAADVGVLTEVYREYGLSAVFLREHHRILAQRNGIPRSVYLFDTEAGELISYVHCEYADLNTFDQGYVYDIYDDVYYDIDLNPRPSRPDFTNATLTLETGVCVIANVGYTSTSAVAMVSDSELNVSLAVSLGDGTVLYDYYAEEALATADGSVLVYTPDGYGVILIGK